MLPVRTLLILLLPALCSLVLFYALGALWQWEQVHNATLQQIFSRSHTSSGNILFGSGVLLHK